QSPPVAEGSHGWFLIASHGLTRMSTDNRKGLATDHLISNLWLVSKCLFIRVNPCSSVAKKQSPPAAEGSHGWF
ncbi:MAG: hypothetical protein ACKON9_29390, partial [Planctomycetaceae bacterium]